MSSAAAKKKEKKKKQTKREACFTKFRRLEKNPTEKDAKNDKQSTETVENSQNCLS